MVRMADMTRKGFMAGDLYCDVTTHRDYLGGKRHDPR